MGALVGLSGREGRGGLTSHLAPIGGAFCHFYRSSVLMHHISPGWGVGGMWGLH